MYFSSHLLLLAVSSSGFICGVGLVGGSRSSDCPGDPWWDEETVKEQTFLISTHFPFSARYFRSCLFPFWNILPKTLDYTERCSEQKIFIQQFKCITFFLLKIDQWSVKITLIPIRCPFYIHIFRRQIFWSCIIYYSLRVVALYFLFFWYWLSTGLECRLPIHSLDSCGTNIMADVFIFFLKRRGGSKTITS